MLWYNSDFCFHILWPFFLCSMKIFIGSKFPFNYVLDFWLLSKENSRVLSEIALIAGFSWGGRAVHQLIFKEALLSVKILGGGMSIALSCYMEIVPLFLHISRMWFTIHFFSSLSKLIYNWTSNQILPRSTFTFSPFRMFRLGVVGKEGALPCIVWGRKALYSSCPYKYILENHIVHTHISP